MEKHYTVNVFYGEMVKVNVFTMKWWIGQTRHGLKNHKHELNYGNLILRDRKIFGNYFNFKYIIPKCLMRIWINAIIFEILWVTFQRERGKGRSWSVRGICRDHETFFFWKLSCVIIVEAETFHFSYCNWLHTEGTRIV